MIYYEMAGKFLEFEAEEEMQIQKLQWMKGPQCPPPSALLRLEPQGPSAPEVVKQPVYLPSKAGLKAPPACLPPPRPQRPAETKAHLPPPRPQWTAETKTPEEIPPEVVQEYVDIMEELLGPPAGTTGELERQREEGEVGQEGDGMLSDPDLLSYIDKLCSQKDFVTKVGSPEVEAVIHPRSLEELLSPDPQMDFLALSQELEQEGLTLAQVEQGGRGTQGPRGLGRPGKQAPPDCLPHPAGDARLLGGPLRGGEVQVAEKRLPSLKEERCARASHSHGTTWLDPSPSKSTAGQGAERDVPQQGVGLESCPPQKAALDPQGRGRACTGISRSNSPVELLESLDSRRLRATQPYSPPQDHTPTCPGLGTKDTLGLPGGCPVRESHGLAQGSSEEEEELASLAFLLGSQHRLLPWSLPQSPVPASGLLSPEGRGPQGAPQSPSALRGGLSPALAPTTKSKKRALLGGPPPAEQTPHLGPGLRVSGAQSLAWGPRGPSQPQKRKSDPLVSSKKKRARSQ
ncbi:NUT member 2D [Saguinus oedipus]|uniref:NUT member 2D n=1 Tax=Saguinus oedipus TaxID=9490 RepID=A0ABQ9UNQ9_SAGOE|nr:NUT member 2D [Saguinus oedipus]